MLRFIVDWIDHVAGRSQAEEIDIQGHDAIAANIPDVGPLPASDFEPLERQLSDTAHPTASQLGIRFQQREFRKLLNAVGHWESVEFYTLNGARIETIEDVPLGPDGGIDLVIRIVTDTELGAKRIAGRIPNVAVENHGRGHDFTSHPSPPTANDRGCVQY